MWIDNRNTVVGNTDYSKDAYPCRHRMPQVKKWFFVYFCFSILYLFLFSSYMSHTSYFWSFLKILIELSNLSSDRLNTFPDEESKRLHETKIQLLCFLPSRLLFLQARASFRQSIFLVTQVWNKFSYKIRTMESS